ncbi:hypothetical protein DB30_02168 [Enhygromyxa salina]|uniref:Uncharacterized protein n=1 Tax=Enhygromyxa salina TaxID=215803 RepID=A0A0C2A3J4_9BACT|nr:DUF2378 family protein [Enhygromyxa salina]KIG17953.1 hypothetical protein DB30_02168 [Enhygromyxa salina]
MLIALEGEQPFVKPRAHFELDLEDITARIVGVPTIKGMFFNRTLELVAERADERDIICAAGLDDDRFVPFRDYPWVNFLRLNCAVSDVIYDGSRSAGLRHIGRTLYATFADSLPGRVTFGVLRHNADRVMRLGAKAWNMSGNPGEVFAESVGDRHYRYHFARSPSEVTETLGVGVLEGALAECNEVPRVLFGYADPMHTVLDIRWGD